MDQDELKRRYNSMLRLLLNINENVRRHDTMTPEQRAFVLRVIHDRVASLLDAMQTQERSND